MSYSKNVLLAALQQSLHRIRKWKNGRGRIKLRDSIKATLLFLLYFMYKVQPKKGQRGFLLSSQVHTVCPTKPCQPIPRAAPWESCKNRHTIISLQVSFTGGCSGCEPFFFPFITLVHPSIEAWIKRDVLLQLMKWGSCICRAEIITGKVKWGCHERQSEKEREALERDWNGEWHQTDWTIIHKWMEWKIFFNIFAQAENTTCSDTPEMIRLQNGIIRISCKKERDEKLTLACRKCGKTVKSRRR